MARQRDTGGWLPTEKNEAVSELVASTNRSHIAAGEWDSPFIASPTGGFSADAEGFIAALRHCADLVEALGHDPGLSRARGREHQERSELVLQHCLLLGVGEGLHENHK